MLPKQIKKQSMMKLLAVVFLCLPILSSGFAPNSFTKSFECKLLGVHLQQSKSPSEVIERVDLSSEFSRWTFLQDILEEDAESQDANEVLYWVLKSFIENPREKQLLSDEQRNILLLELFHIEDGVRVIRALPEIGGEYNEVHEKTLELLNKLQPDPVENEDDFKSCWDILLMLYGMEATKYAQKTEDVEFKFRSSVVRILLHYDFLTEGVGK